MVEGGKLRDEARPQIPKYSVQQNREPLHPVRGEMPNNKTEIPTEKAMRAGWNRKMGK